MNGKALGWFCIIKDIEPKITKNKIGLELSAEHREDIRYRKAEIISVGAEIDKLKAGDTVSYDRHAGNQLEEGDNLYKVIQANDIVVVW